MINKSLFSSDSTEWETPHKLYDYLNKYFGTFTLDVAATQQNTKCKHFFTKTSNGLRNSWQGNIVFCNPPYGRSESKLWTEKAYTEVFRSVVSDKHGVVVDPLDENYVHTKVVMLLPARTDTFWFHNYCINAQQIYFIQGRLYFESNGIPHPSPAPFPSMIVIWDSSALTSPPSWGVVSGKLFKNKSIKGVDISE